MGVLFGGLPGRHWPAAAMEAAYARATGGSTIKELSPCSIRVCRAVPSAAGKNGLILIRHTAAHRDPRALTHVDDFTVEISVIRINLSVLADGIQEAQGGQVTKFNCVRRTLKV